MIGKGRAVIVRRKVRNELFSRKFLWDHDGREECYNRFVTTYPRSAGIVSSDGAE